jgi:catechol 2,3-dioxygenase-like lactoylglutathione lyase family enzyme
LSTTPNGQMVFLDAAGTCLILVKRNPPINSVPDNHGGMHHAFAVAHDEYAAALEHLRAHGVEIAFEEDRQGGVLNGPRAYFHDQHAKELLGQAAPVVVIALRLDNPPAKPR